MIAMCSCLHIYVMDPNLVPNNIELEGVIMAKSEKSFFFLFGNNFGINGKGGEKRAETMCMSSEQHGCQTKNNGDSASKNNDKMRMTSKVWKNNKNKNTNSNSNNHHQNNDINNQN